MLKRLCLIILIIPAAFVAFAQDSERLDPLVDALQLHQIFAVMREEGLEYGRNLDREMLQGTGGAKWQVAVEGIYEQGRIWQTFLPRFTTELEAADIDAMVAFFDTERGRRIISQEVLARRALLDKTVEEQSHETLREMLSRDDPRLTLLRDFIEANDLVEFNVMGAMNSNYAFYTGMIDGRAFNFELSEEDILKDVWAQEAEIREDTEEWLFSYLALAYKPLSDADLQAYIDFSDTKAGRALNRALFAGFDDVFINVSKALGLSAAEFMKGEEL